MSDLDRACQAIRSAAFDDALADRLGLNATDLRCLELVIAEPGLTAGRLAERATLTTGAVTGVLDRLESAGFVRRQPDPADRRSVTISAVDARAAEVRAALDPLSKAVAAALGKLSGGERSAVFEFLEATRAAVDEETARLRARARGGFVGDAYIAPIGGATRGRLVFSTGAPRVALNFSPLGPRAAARVIMETAASRLRFDGPAPPGELLRATFDGPRPEIRVSGGVVSVRYRRQAIAAFSSRQAKVQLAAGIPWTIELDGGLTDLTGTLRDVVLAGIEVAGGANHVTLDLPAPAGTVPIRLGGVASSVKLRRPETAPVALQVDGGVAHLRVDARKAEQVGGRRRFESDRFASSPDRYEIEILGGASEVKVTVS
jgi:DNA-binding MarR family transcriptional regulator